MQLTDELRQELQEKVGRMKLEGARRKELTRHVAMQLSFKGYKPSVCIVRDITQQGSLTDISRDLTELREEIGKALSRRTLKTSMPESYLQMVEQTIEQLWTGAVDTASKALEAEQIAAGKLRDDALREVETIQALRAEELLHRQALQQALDDERRRSSDAEQQAAALQAQCRELAESVARWQANTETERRLRTEEHQRFSTELELMRQEHGRALEQAEGNRRYVLLQLDTAREAERNLRERVRQVEDDRTAQEQRTRVELNHLRDRNGAMSLQLGELKGELKAKETHLAEANKRIADLESRLDSERIALSARNDDMLQDLRAAALGGLLSAVRNAPHVFQLCDEINYQVRVELEENGKPLLWLEDEGGNRIGSTSASVNDLDAKCQQLLDR
ncbi:DNA-binding protein [Noviherbaspirillum sp.]|uniref:DNA-binding protein n=1 Tax=Noviherbaspirillum sp. TaxID=1926288 RepID=UPI002FE37009